MGRETKEGGKYERNHLAVLFLQSFLNGKMVIIGLYVFPLNLHLIDISILDWTQTNSLQFLLISLVYVMHKWSCFGLYSIDINIFIRCEFNVVDCMVVVEMNFPTVLRERNGHRSIGDLECNYHQYWIIDRPCNLFTPWCFYEEIKTQSYRV